MRKNLIYIIGLLTLTVLVGCNKDKDNTTYYEQEYPPTAIVLKQAVTDYDGNVYDAVQIGNQIWMASNLRTRHYNDGTSVVNHPSIYDHYTRVCYDAIVNGEYIYLEAPPIYGNYYPYPDDKLCPTGWHIPSYEEWEELIDYVDNVYHGACALAATSDWSASDVPNSPGSHLSANNATGFSALPSAGYCGSSEWTPYEGHYAVFWNKGASYYEDDYEGGEAEIRYDESSVDNNYYTHHVPVGYGGWPIGVEYCIRCVRD